MKIAVVIGLLGAGILYKNGRAVEKGPPPCLADDDAQYGNEYDFSHELAGRHSVMRETEPGKQVYGQDCSRMKVGGPA